MKKIIVVILVMTLVIPMSILSDESHPQVYGTASDVYVDDNAPLSWYDSVHVKTIQEGVNNVSLGRTIYVWEGTYNESVTVNKPVPIIGNSTSNTTVNGGGSDAITIVNHSVNISFLNITSNNRNGIKLTSVNNTNISNCYFKTNNSYGVRAYNSNYTHIYDNDFNDTDARFEYCCEFLNISYNKNINNLRMTNTVVSDEIHISRNNNIQGGINSYSSSVDSIYVTWNNFTSESAVSLGECSNIFVENNSFDSSSIHLDGEGRNYAIKNNSLTNYGHVDVYFESLDIYQHLNIEFSNNTVNGRELVWLSDTIDEVIDSEIGGIIVVNCGNITVQNIELLSGNGLIQVHYSDNVTVSNITCSLSINTLGLMNVNDSKLEFLNFTSVVDDGSGCSIVDCLRIDIENCTLGGFPSAITADVESYDYNKNLNIINNTINATNVGIEIGGLNDSVIKNNTIVCNSVGEGFTVFLDACSNITIYNNNFTGNASGGMDADSSNIKWNISKTPGTNIYGGPYLGGNHWEGYTGVDTNGDGIGDTNLPYNNEGNMVGDFCPLVTPQTLPSIVYVSGSMYSGWYNQSKVATIEEGINNVTSGGTIYVWAGTYNEENLTIDHSLSLIGNATTDTILKGTNNSVTGITINANWVNISGFNMTNFTVSGETSTSCIYSNFTNHINISGNYFYGNTFAVNCSVEINNDIQICNNTMVNCGCSILMADEDSRVENVTVSSNYIVCYQQVVEYSRGIYVYFCNNSCFTNNTLLNLTSYGMELEYIENTTISDNVFGNCSGGAFCSIYGSSRINIVNNTLYNRSSGTFPPQAGGCLLEVQNSDNCTVENNTIWNATGGGYYGIYLHHSENLTVRNNTVYSCDVGIKTYQINYGNIYNNYFNNTDNAQASLSNFLNWNITKTLGNNIIDGPYLGGNYWSNYTGNDTTGDGLGDTPYNITGGGQDMLPLVYTTQELDEYPSNDSDDISRPPVNLSVYVANPSSVDIYFYNMTPIVDKWTLLQHWASTSGRVEVTNLTDWETDFIWGNTTYQWAVNISGTNHTYTYTTTQLANGANARYDVSNDDWVDGTDLLNDYAHRTGEVAYKGIYDVNTDDWIDGTDLLQIYANKS